MRFAFSEIRRDTPPAYYDDLAARFRSNAFYRLKIFGEPFPTSPAQIKRLQPLQAIATREEILWAESSLKFYAKFLNRFSNLRNEISKLIGEDLYGDAANTLNDIEREFGLSLWAYSVGFVLRDQTQGPEANTAIYTTLRTTPGINGFTYYIIFYLGFRTSPGSTVQHLREEIPDSNTVYDALSIYITNKLTPFHFDRENKQVGVAAAILRHDTNSSIIDLYCSFHRALSIAVSHGEVSHQFAGESAARLNAVIPDRRSRVIAQFGGSAPIEYDIRTDALLSALDLIYGAEVGDEQEHISTLLSALGWTGESADSISAQIRQSVQTLTSQQGARHDAAEALEKICTAISDLDEARCVFSIGRRLWIGGSTLSLFGSLESALCTGATLPDLAEFMDCETGRSYLQQLEAIYGSRPSVRTFQRLIGSAIQSPTTASEQFVDALRLAKAGQFEQALHHLAPIPNGRTSPLWQALPLRAILYLALNRLEDAVQLIAFACVTDGDAWASLPVKETVERVLEAGGPSESFLEWSVVLDVATNRLDQKYARFRSYAVEDAWEARGLTSPSAIVLSLDPREQILATYYLHKLCNSEVLSDSDRFQSVRDLEEERIRVCQALVEIDPNNAELYLTEIRSITRWLVIYDGLRSVEQSKIHVDVPGLRSYLTPLIGPEYDRMIALRREKNALGNVDELIKQDIITYRDDELTGNLLFRYAFDDPSKILQHLLAIISREYASNSRFGLDVYLSTRIRHGTLKGHLRSPLEDNHVINQRSGSEYRDNAHWIGRIEEISEWPEENFLQSISTFSALIDDDIAELNKTYLRLHTIDNPSGWFNVSLRERDAKILDHFMSSSQLSFNDFLDGVLEVLNARLQHSLVHVQAELQTNIRGRWGTYFRDLREAAQAIGSPQLRNEADAAIAAAQVASDVAIRRVSGWFTLSTAKESPDYTIGLAIDIATKSVQNCFGNNVIALGTIAGDDPFLKGGTLASLVDVFFILFENIAKHARGATTAIADISVVQSDKYYTITVRNDLPGEVDRAALATRIASITESLGSENADRLVTEGGTGYHKLRKIIGYDLGLEHDFEFGIRGEQYEVIIVLDVSAVMA